MTSSGRCDTRESAFVKAEMSTLTTIHPTTTTITARMTFSSVISESGMVVVLRISTSSMH